MYNEDIFIMKNGELEDYYKEENFGDEFLGINAKGLKAYKISELSDRNGIATYMYIDEYREILPKILGKRKILGYDIGLKKYCGKKEELDKHAKSGDK